MFISQHGSSTWNFFWVFEVQLGSKIPWPPATLYLTFPICTYGMQRTPPWVTVRKSLSDQYWIWFYTEAMFIWQAYLKNFFFFKSDLISRSLRFTFITARWPIPVFKMNTLSPEHPMHSRNALEYHRASVGSLQFYLNPFSKHQRNHWFPESLYWWVSLLMLISLVVQQCCGHWMMTTTICTLGKSHKISSMSVLIHASWLHMGCLQPKD